MRASLVALALVPTASWACINDRDTLAFELSNRPDTQRVLTGWFDRYPAQYYQMRIDRLEKKQNLALSEIDDLAAAYERIGNSNKAIEVIERKQKYKLDKENQYTYHANRGTFYAHRWVAKRKPSDLKTAIADIDTAIKLKPDAHFGREKAQLEVLRAVSEGAPIGMMVSSVLGRKDAEVGLVGLIMLGAAWESPDIVAALAYVLSRTSGSSSVMSIAKMRYDELLKAGKKPLTSTAEQDLQSVSGAKAGPLGERGIADQFRELRLAADRRHNQRTAFLLAEMKKGRHPDTHADFWTGWKEPTMPKPNTGWALPRSFGSHGMSPLSLFLFGTPVVCILLIVLIKVRHSVRKRRSQGA